MSVLLITQHYKPEPNFITADVAEALGMNLGEVTVVTAHPNYPLGRYYDSVRSARPSKESAPGLTIWRLPLFVDHSRSKLRRLVYYLSFTLAAALWAPFVAGKPKVVIVYQTPFTAALAALFFKIVYGSRLIFIGVDLWPESFEASGIRMSKRLGRLLYCYSQWINHFADMLICTTRGMQRRYIADGYPEERTLLIPLWVDGSGHLAPPIPCSSGNEVLRVVYIGNLGLAQDISTVLKAAKLLQERKRPVSFEIFGSGLEEARLRQEAQDLGLENTIFHGRISSSEAFRVAAASDVQLIHLTSSPLFNMTVPSKLAFSLSVGRCILAGVAGESADILRDAACGEVVAPQRPEEMAAAIDRLTRLSAADRERLGQNGRTFYESHFAKERLLQRWVETVTSVHDKTVATCVKRGDGI